MLKTAAAIGMSINDFYDATPFELAVYAESFAERHKEDAKYKYQLAVITAYCASRWVWAKRVNIDKYLKDDRDSSNSSNNRFDSTNNNRLDSNGFNSNGFNSAGKPTNPGKQMSDEEMFNKVKTINMMFGGI